MGKLINNGIMKGASGGYGKQIVFRRGKGQTIIFGGYPTRTAPPTEKEKEQHERFRLASAYAKRIKENADVWAKYEAKAKGSGRSARTFGIQDFLRLPIISHINTRAYSGTVGDKIHIISFDDFDIKSVAVKITASNGKTVESGDAVFTDGQWVNTATVANSPLAGSKIIATATDLPGNTAEKVITL